MVCRKRAAYRDVKDMRDEYEYPKKKGSKDVCSRLLEDAFVFFFQAEDGIRDYKVTGVQTCALPILMNAVTGTASLVSLSTITAMPTPQLGWQPQLSWPHCAFGPWTRSAQSLYGPIARSEERRVGKECRSRWSPYH